MISGQIAVSEPFCCLINYPILKVFCGNTQMHNERKNNEPGHKTGRPSITAVRTVRIFHVISLFVIASKPSTVQEVKSFGLTHCEYVR